MGRVPRQDQLDRHRRIEEKKIRIALEGLRGESSIAELSRREGIAQSIVRFGS